MEDDEEEEEDEDVEEVLSPAPLVECFLNLSSHLDMSSW